jgi:hypothetical protein
LNLLFEQARASLEREGDTILRDAFAGAIVTILHGMLRDYWTIRKAPKRRWKEGDPKIAGFSVPQIFSAAFDNLQYWREWDAEKMSALAHRRSVKILSAVLEIPLKKNAKRLPFRGNVCWSVLEALGGAAGYARIESLVRQAASELDAAPNA